METIKLEVNREIYDKLMWFLKQFKPEDLRVVEEKEDEEFLRQKKEIQKTLDYMDSGKAKFYSLEEFNQLMEVRIKKHESKNP